MGVYNSLPRGLRQCIGKIQEDIDDQEENFVDFESGLDWTLRLANS
jgi:hypothetical protein